MGAATVGCWSSVCVSFHKSFTEMNSEAVEASAIHPATSTARPFFLNSSLKKTPVEPANIANSNNTRSTAAPPPIETWIR